MKNTAVLELGFRPFFILASFAACLLLGLWILVYSGHLSMNPRGGVIGWHGHEMLFGYTTAILTGFFLTAVKNWTGLPTLTGPWLGVLAGLWLLGRLVPFMPEGIANLLGSRIDMIFLPILAGIIFRPIYKARQWRNIGFPIILMVMTVGNVLCHMEWMGETQGTVTHGLNLALNMVLLIIVWVFGRIFPFFASRVLPKARIKSYPFVEALSIGSIILWAWVQINWTDPKWITGAAAVVALIHAVRLVGFHDRTIWRVPLVWILFTGYCWLVVGFLLHALIPHGNITPFLARHAFTTGAVGVITLGMIVRVSLGHTGRPLKPSPLVVATFVFVNLAVVVRVLFPMFLPSGYFNWIMVSGILWTLSFGIFALNFFPILFKPRPDGKPG